MTLEQGSDKHEKEVRSGDGFISQSDLRLHFGLGQSAKAEKVVIRWPSGLVETLSDLPANQYYVVREGSGVDQARRTAPVWCGLRCRTRTRSSTSSREVDGIAHGVDREARITRPPD